MFKSGDSIVNRTWALRLTAARGLSALLGATLFPPRCCLCGFEGSPPDLDLCGYCREDLPWDQQAIPGVVTALRFEAPADELIRRLKYDGVTANARLLGELLARAARARAVALPKLLVPVPLHEARLCERGFNQSLAIARFAGRALGVRHARHALRRVRNTPSQTGLGVEQRHMNVRGAFQIVNTRARSRLLDAGHVAVVDDVTTTGSTLAEVQSVLLAAGVRQVDLWAVARAP
jgi:ComF family protein